MKKTARNLAAAFVGESQARNRYTFYAKAARKEGQAGLADFFLQTAEHEREHAATLFKLLQSLRQKGAIEGDTLHIEAEVPLGYGGSPVNLRAAMAGEHHEQTEMYPGFAVVADAEGLPDVAARLRAIGRAERYHEERYAGLLSELETGKKYAYAGPEAWSCSKCGYVHEGAGAPAQCPACGHDKEYFKKL